MSQGAENQPFYAILCQKLHKKNSDSKFNRFFPTFNLKYQTWIRGQVTDEFFRVEKKTTPSGHIFLYCKYKPKLTNLYFEIFGQLMSQHSIFHANICMQSSSIERVALIC